MTVGLGDDESMTCPLNLQNEMKEYVLKHAYVSSVCRLSKDEETLLCYFILVFYEAEGRG